MSESDYEEEPTHLDTEQLARAEALRLARGVLGWRSGGILSTPGQVSTLDLYCLASWIMTGIDPWASNPLFEGMAAVPFGEGGTQFLKRLCEEQAVKSTPEFKCECGSEGHTTGEHRDDLRSEWPEAYPGYTSSPDIDIEKDDVPIPFIPTVDEPSGDNEMGGK